MEVRNANERLGTRAGIPRSLGMLTVLRRDWDIDSQIVR